MERRRALAIVGALTATLLTGTVAAGAVGGFFGFTPAESGASPATTDPPPSSRPVITVHVPGPASEDPPSSTPSTAAPPRVVAAGRDAATSYSDPTPISTAAAPAAPATPVAAGGATAVVPAPTPAGDDAAEPVGDDDGAAPPPGEHEDAPEHEDEPEHEVDD